MAYEKSEVVLKEIGIRLDKLRQMRSIQEKLVKGSKSGREILEHCTRVAETLSYPFDELEQALHQASYPLMGQWLENRNLAVGRQVRIEMREVFMVGTFKEYPGTPRIPPIEKMFDRVELRGVLHQTTVAQATRFLDLHVSDLVIEHTKDGCVQDLSEDFAMQYYRKSSNQWVPASIFLAKDEDGGGIVRVPISFLDARFVFLD